MKLLVPGSLCLVRRLVLDSSFLVLSSLLLRRPGSQENRTNHQPPTTNHQETKEMPIRRFEEIEGWQLARELTKQVYTVAMRGAFAKDLDCETRLPGQRDRRCITSLKGLTAEVMLSS